MNSYYPNGNYQRALMLEISLTQKHSRMFLFSREISNCIAELQNVTVSFPVAIRRVIVVGHHVKSQLMTSGKRNT